MKRYKETTGRKAVTQKEDRISKQNEKTKEKKRELGRRTKTVQNRRETGKQLTYKKAVTRTADKIGRKKRT